MRGVRRPSAPRLHGTLLAVLACLLAGAAHAGAARILGVRHSTNEGNTRIVIDLSAPTRFEHLRLDDPPRVAVDIEAEFSPELQPLSVGDGRVQRVRLGRLDGEHSRLVVDLDRILDYRGFEVPGTRSGARAWSSTSSVRRPPRGRPTDRSAPPPAVLPPPARTGPVSWSWTPDMVDRIREPRPWIPREGDLPGDRPQGGRELNRRPGYRARLTRDEDQFIPLRQRIVLAEKAGADAFVSIHCNASKSGSAHGTEVYYLSLSGATDEASRELARLENAAT